MAARNASADHGRVEELPVEDQVAVDAERRPRPRWSRRTAHRPSSVPGSASTTARKRADQCRQVRLVLVVEVDLSGPAPTCPAAAGWTAASGCLRNTLKTSSRKPSTPRSSQPRTIVELRGLDRRIAPVEVGLLGQERVLVELAAARLPGPGRAAEERDPVVGRPRPTLGVRGRPGRATGTSPRHRAVARGRECLEPADAASLEWFMTRSRIDPDATPVGLADEPVEVGLGAEPRIDRASGR